VCLGLAVLVVAVVALRQPGDHGSSAGGKHSSVSSVAKQSTTKPAAPSTAIKPARTRSTTAKTGDSKSASTVKDVPLIVLNNTTTQGLAKQAAARFETGGWTVTHYDNYQNDIISTCAYYDASDPKAKPAADALRAQYPTIQRVEPKFAELPSGPIVVVLTPDYSSD
jgi:hypothetical protein